MKTFEEDSRIEHDLAMSFGDIVVDKNGNKWVFLGWRKNTAGAFPVFAKEQQGEYAGDGWLATLHTYHCSFTNTVLNKFPDAARFIRSVRS